MTHLELVDLTKVYNEGQDDEIIAVDELNVSLDQGEFLVLVGPSGCGKSTTLRCIAGLETITSGEIRIDDVVVNDMTPEERDIAMVFQNYALYPHMTARENMSFGLKMTTNLSADEIARRVDEAADMMGIEELLEDKPRELSGGQQQRVALGRAIVREPEVFLLDEPLSNLDAKLRTRMRTEIQQLQRELDVTTVYVTHDQTEAMTMGDRIAVLNDGELQQLGTPLECYHEPANRFVAGFIGEPSMNFFDVVREDDALVGEALAYPLDERLADVEGDRFALGIRPEDVRLADADGPHAYRADVQVVEPMGDNNVVIVDLGGVETIAETDGGVRIEEGSTVRIEFPPEYIHLFDARTGEAVINRSFSETDVSPAVLE